MGLHKNGLRAGFTGYRYGGERPVTLAGSQSAKQRPIVRKGQRESLVNQLIDVMGEWRKTPFEGEGSARTGLRKGFVLEGYDWHQSDAQAEDLVAEALRLLGAKRPTHEEAQRAYVLTGDYCHWCYTPFDEKDRSRGKRFCSSHCAAAAKLHMSKKAGEYEGAILRSAQRIIDREKAPPQKCEHCQRSFQADRQQRFCTLSCKTLAQVGDHILLQRPCALCGEEFKPWNHRQLYCSKACGVRASRKTVADAMEAREVTCAECGVIFKPTVHHSKFCSRACNERAHRPKWNAMKRAPKPPLALCSWCGDEFQPGQALRPEKASACSPKCRSDMSRFNLGASPRDLTRRTFDHYIVLPMDQQWRRRVTPQKLDWQFMEMGLRLTGEAALPAPRVTDGLFA